MNLSKKIFVAFLGLLTVFSVSISFFLYANFSNRYTETFNQFYTSVNQSLSDTLVQLDQETNSKIFNVKMLIENDERAFEGYTNEELKDQAKKWGVSHLYTINSRDGKYLTSSCEPPDELPSIYEYCQDYRALAEGRKEYELTPLVFGIPEHEAYKFFHFPSKDKTRIYEIALHARFIGRTLKKTLEAYSAIFSIGLFSPNGDSLGLFLTNQEVGRVEKLNDESRSYPSVLNESDKFVYFTKVASEVTDCCQCKKHMNPSVPNDFSYILRTEVSKRGLKTELNRTILVIVFFTLVAFLLSIACARFLAGALTKKLRLVNDKIFSIIESGKLDDRIAIEGNDEISQLGSNFNRMIDRLKTVQNQLIQLEINSAIAKTTQMLAHDVRRPFSMLKGLLAIFAGSDNPIVMKEMARKHLPDVEKAILSVNGMIEDVMEIGRTSKPNQVPTSPTTLIEASLNEICQIIQREDIEIKYDLNHTQMVAVDTLKCQRVFVNILTNAFQAMPVNSLLWFSTYSDAKGFVRFSIGNSGSFIEEKSLSQIFAAFYTNDKKNGTGLGLAIAEKVVLAHGGRIWCESFQKKQTVEIFFTLPVARFSKLPDSKSSRSLPSKTQEIVAGFRRFLNMDYGDIQKIISDPRESEFELRLIDRLSPIGRTYIIGLVEDEALYQNALKELIEKYSTLRNLIHVVTLNDAQTALSFVEHSLPDVLICDIDLGIQSISGFELVRELRMRGYGGPICVHSNRCLPEDYESAIKAGAQSFLPKPMSRVHLLKFILNSIDGPVSSAAKPQVGPVGTTSHDECR